MEQKVLSHRAYVMMTLIRFTFDFTFSSVVIMELLMEDQRG